ncbi:RidA family protein [Glutamicibacter sp. NPDC087831]|uniref:RidA family protein n=2 Tax=Micrococcaceae TaxID=1268 RepID=UPI00268BAD13
MPHWTMEQIRKLRPAGLVNSPAFSHVAIVPPGATTIYVGGQNAVDGTGQLIGAGDAATQATKALGNAKLALAAASAGFQDVVQWNVLLVEGTDVNSVYGALGEQLAATEPPLVSAAFVAKLGVPGALVEISAVATVLPD